MKQPWDDVISDDDLSRYARAGFGHPSGLGSKPALLVIDVQFRTLGDSPKPFDEAIEDYSTACGRVGWDAVAKITELLAHFRANDLPVLYPHVAPKEAHDAGTLGAKVPSIMSIAAKGYGMPDEVAPRPEDVMLPKKHPSAFFGTPLVSHLIDLGVDTLIVVGCSTSGCVRATTVDGFAYNFKIVVPSDAVYDRSETVHKINLFDMGQKYADVMPTADLIEQLNGSTAGGGN